MSDAMSIALSGMRAATLRLDAAASNIANMPVTGSVSGAPGAKRAYQPVSVDQTSLSGPQGLGGVEARTRPVMPAFVPAFEPDASYADADGLVAVPNVDPLEEMVSLTEASLAFRLNAATLKTAAEMVRSLYEDTSSD